MGVAFSDGAHLTRTLNAPNGVTTVAGAKAYAAKFTASPIPTARQRTVSHRNAT